MENLFNLKGETRHVILLMSDFVCRRHGVLQIYFPCTVKLFNDCYFIKGGFLLEALKGPKKTNAKMPYNRRGTTTFSPLDPSYCSTLTLGDGTEFLSQKTPVQNTTSLLSTTDRPRKLTDQSYLIFRSVEDLEHNLGRILELMGVPINDCRAVKQDILYKIMHALSNPHSTP